MAAAELFGCRFQVYRNGQIFYTFGQPPMPLKYLRFTGDDFSSGHFDVYECLNSQKLDVKLSMKPVVYLQCLTDAECLFNTSPTNTVVIETNHETQTDYDSSNPSWISCSRIRISNFGKHGVFVVNFARRGPIRSFSQSSVYFAAKDGTTKDGTGDGKGLDGVTADNIANTNHLKPLQFSPELIFSHSLDSEDLQLS
ncbi:CLPX protease, partial [Polypterus senegalus]